MNWNASIYDPQSCSHSHINKYSTGNDYILVWCHVKLALVQFIEVPDYLKTDHWISTFLPVNGHGPEFNCDWVHSLLDELRNMTRFTSGVRWALCTAWECQYHASFMCKQYMITPLPGADPENFAWGGRFNKKYLLTGLAICKIYIKFWAWPGPLPWSASAPSPLYIYVCIYYFSCFLIVIKANLIM